MNIDTVYSKILIEGMRTNVMSYIRVRYIDVLHNAYDYKPIDFEEFYYLRRLLKEEMTPTINLNEREKNLLEKLGLDLTKDFAAESSYLALEVVK